MLSGYPFYGQTIGVLVFAGNTPRIRGDPGHAETFRYPVRYRVVEGSFAELAAGDPTVLERIAEAVRMLRAEGVRGVIGDCGLMSLCQQAAGRELPFLGSALCLIPFIWQMLGQAGAIGVLTGHSDLLRRPHLEAAGWTDAIPLAVQGMENRPHFRAVVLKGGMSLDPVLMEADTVEAALELQRRSPGLRALVLECSNLAAHSRAVAKALCIPVFDIVSAANLLEYALNPIDFTEPPGAKRGAAPRNKTRSESMSVNSVNWEKIRREEFPFLETMTFLDAACVSFAPQRTVRALKDFADFTARQDEINSSAHHIAMDSLRHKAYAEACKLLNAYPEEIALVESTTHGLNIAATSLPLEDGDNIVTTNLEFIQVALPWCAMRKSKQIDIRVVKTPDNRFEAKDFAALCDEHTRMIVISTVEWCNGWRMDLKEIGDYCHKNGIYLVVDAVQELGIIKMDTQQFHVDILSAGGHKWLNSPFGTGVLYINRALLPHIQPVFWGYLNTEVPEGGWGAYWENPAAPAVGDWKFVPTARRFEIGGTANYCGAIALGETLGLVNEIGIENIEAKILENTTYCMDELEKIGATLITHRDIEHRSGIVIARLYQDLEIERDILRKLHARGVMIAQRFTDYVGGFRISCQYFNNKKDFDTLIEALREQIAAIGRQPDYKG